jgi:hypothetical protein
MNQELSQRKAAERNRTKEPLAETPQSPGSFSYKSVGPNKRIMNRDEQRIAQML